MGWKGVGGVRPPVASHAPWQPSSDAVSRVHTCERPSTRQTSRRTTRASLLSDRKKRGAGERLLSYIARREPSRPNPAIVNAAYKKKAIYGTKPPVTPPPSLLSRFLIPPCP